MTDIASVPHPAHVTAPPISHRCAKLPGRECFILGSVTFSNPGAWLGESASALPCTANHRLHSSLYSVSRMQCKSLFPSEMPLSYVTVAAAASQRRCTCGLVLLTSGTAASNSRSRQYFDHPSWIFSGLPIESRYHENDWKTLYTLLCAVIHWCPQ